MSVKRNKTLDCSFQIQYFITILEPPAGRLSDLQWLIHAVKSISGPCDLVGCGTAEHLCAGAASWLIDSGATGALLAHIIVRNKGGLHQMSDGEVGSHKAGADRSIWLCVKYEQFSFLMGRTDRMKRVFPRCNKMQIGRRSVRADGRSDSNVRGGRLISPVRQLQVAHRHSIRTLLSSTQVCCRLTGSPPHFLLVQLLSYGCTL